jgi:hypothetical protein
MVRRGLLCALWCAAMPTGTGAQSVDLDFAVEQAFTTLRDMGTPTGYRTGISLANLVGPVGVDVGYRSISEYLGERPQRCGMDVCTPGPFDTVMRMRAVWLGMSVSRMLNPFVQLSVGGAATLTWQDTEYGPTGTEPTGLTATETAGPDLGGGVFATWRFPPIVSVLRPFLYARAEWVRSGPCAADAPCFGTRYLGSGGIGLYARIP